MIQFAEKGVPEMPEWLLFDEAVRHLLEGDPDRSFSVVYETVVGPISETLSECIRILENHIAAAVQSKDEGRSRKLKAQLREAEYQKDLAATYFADLRVAAGTVESEPRPNTFTADTDHPRIHRDHLFVTAWNAYGIDLYGCRARMAALDQTDNEAIPGKRPIPVSQEPSTRELDAFKRKLTEVRQNSWRHIRAGTPEGYSIEPGVLHEGRILLLTYAYVLGLLLNQLRPNWRDEVARQNIKTTKAAIKSGVLNIKEITDLMQAEVSTSNPYSSDVTFRKHIERAFVETIGTASGDDAFSKREMNKARLSLYAIARTYHRQLPGNAHVSSEKTETDVGPILEAIEKNVSGTALLSREDLDRCLRETWNDVYHRLRTQNT